MPEEAHKTGINPASRIANAGQFYSQLCAFAFSSRPPEKRMVGELCRVCNASDAVEVGWLSISSIGCHLGSMGGGNVKSKIRGAAVLRRPPKGRSIWIVANPLFAEPSTGSSMKVPYRRVAKWKPLGVRNHIPSDPTLLRLSGFLRDGKRALMGYVSRAAANDLVIVPLVERWSALTPAARRAVTLTDLCYVCGVTPARFISA